MNAFGSSSRWNSGRTGMQMNQYMAVLGFDTPGRGAVEITDDLRSWMRETDVRIGVLSLLCQHSSASLLISDNASGGVHEHLVSWFDKAVPAAGEDGEISETPDDMPAHIRSVLTGVSLTIPVADGRLMLGKSQGVFLLEHGVAADQRSVAALLVGE